MSARDLIHGEAELDEEGDESFDEETGEVHRRSKGLNGTNGHVQDSSEEEEDDDDEEAARAVRTLVSVATSSEADIRQLARCERDS